MLAGLVLVTFSQAATQDAEPASTEGIVADVQLVDASPLGAEVMLVLVLEDGRGFLIEGQRNLAASRGMQVSLDYLPAEEGGVALACSVNIIAVPVVVAGKEQLQTAQRPFSVYSNTSSSCSPG